MLKLTAGACVRSLSVESECKKCESICPTNAIVVGKPLPAINFSACVSCGGCTSVCPTEALRLEEFNATELFFEFMESEENLLSCKKNVPCLSALSVEHIISMALLKKEIIFDMAHCDTCSIAHSCKMQIMANYEEASYLLEAIESDAKVRLEAVAFESSLETKSDRRDFLSVLNLKTVGKMKKSFEDEMQKADDALIEHTLKKEDIALLRKKVIPERRKLFFMALKRAQKPSVFHTVDANEVSFTSQKRLDETLCTACQMCYRVCPTGALSSNVKNAKIDFDPLVCVKCHICHDVCAPDALTLSKAYNVKEFFEPEVQNLIAFSVKRCDECNVIFSTNNDDRLCYRCKIEEQEARDLWGISDGF